MTKLVYLTAGAGGMFCGSCMHDNALTHALKDEGWDIQLVPTYTPIRTDEQDVSVDQVLFGGVNVYLQQKVPLLRYVPAFLDRFLDSPWLIRRVTSRAMETNPTMLGKLALSMLQGTQGNQRKEVRQIVKWLKLVDPGLIIFSNALIGGCIELLKQETQIPVLVTLQGDDVFLDGLKEPFKSRCIQRISEIAQNVDGFVVQSEFFRDYMAEYFSIPIDKFHVTPLGLDLKDFARFRGPASDRRDERPPTIGYLARLAPEKGLQHLIDGFLELKSRPGNEAVQLRLAGWLGPDHQAFAEKQFQRLEDAGRTNDYEYLGAIERSEKLDFLSQIDLLSVPTEYLEPKGLYALEAMAAGVPVVLPRHGAFPELVEPSEGGLLVPPRDPVAWADAVEQLLGDDERREAMGQRGQAYVWEQRNAKQMAASTSAVIREFVVD